MAVLPSPLSNSIQGINESTVSGSVFGGNKQDPETKSRLQSLSSSIVALQNQVNELNKNNITNVGVFANFQQSFVNQIDSVRLQLSKVDQTLESVATIITSESAIESQKNRYEEEKEKRLAEAGARGGKESLLETKIQSALSEPVNRIGNKVSFGFQNLMSFITTLLEGWLTLEGIKAIKAYQDGDKKQLDDIKNSVIKTLAIAGGIFGVINFGIGRVITTIIGLAAKIGKFVVGGLIIKPFQAVMTGIGNAANGIFRGNKPPTPPPKGQKGPNPAGGKFNVIGGFISVVSGGLNFLNGENVDAALNALTILPIGGKFGTGLRVAAGTIVGLDEIAEFLGGNLTGADPKLLKEKKEELKKAQEAEKNKNKLKSSSIKKSEPPKPEAAKPAPTTSMVPPASNLQINTSDTPKPQTSSPSPEMVSKFEQAWQYKNNPLARGKIESAWDKMSDEEKQQAMDWAKSKKYDWKEMKLPDVTSPKGPTTPSVSSAPAETSSKPPTPEITPAQTTKMQTVPFNIGPEPEPKPNIVYAPSSSSAPPQQQPLKSGPASDVPAIPSSNPDNFYTLYSQINYNVVM